MCLAVPGKILEIREEQHTLMATVDFDGIHKDICLMFKDLGLLEEELGVEPTAPATS